RLVGALLEDRSAETPVFVSSLLDLLTDQATPERGRLLRLLGDAVRVHGPIPPDPADAERDQEDEWEERQSQKPTPEWLRPTDAGSPGMTRPAPPVSSPP